MVAGGISLLERMIDPAHGDFTPEVAFEYAAHDIVSNPVLLGDVLKGAIDPLEQEEFRIGFGTTGFGIVPLRSLGGGQGALTIATPKRLGRNPSIPCRPHSPR